MNERVATAQEQVNNSACDLLMERLNASADCRFVPDVV